MNIKSSLLILVLLLTTSIKAQMFWQRPIANYNRHEYHAGNQNWKIAQHSNGWMYFANNKGLLEFDGKYWNCYPMPHQAKMRSILIGNDQRIYVGGLKEFGVFTPNNLGGLNYKSLSKSMDSHTVSNIWNIHLLDNKVYFQGDRFIFCYDKGRITKIDCDGVSSSGVINHRIYFNNVKGLSYFDGKRVRFIPHSEAFSTKQVVALLPYQNKVLIVTSRQGLYLFDGKQFSPCFPAITPALSGHQVTCAAIQQHKLAVGTGDDGLFLIDLLYNKVEKISIVNGLQNKSLLSVAFDREHNLWVGQDNGIDYIPLNSQLFFLTSKLTSIGAGYCSQYYQGKLYLGTNQGVFTTNLPTTINTPVNPSMLPAMAGLVHCLYAYDGKLFCGGKNFFDMVDGGSIHPFDKRGVWHVEALGPNGNVLLLGTYWGLDIMRKKNGNWTITNSINGCKLSAKSMYIEPESNTVWIANKSEGVWRVTLDTQYTKVLRKKRYNNAQLPIGDNCYITQIGKDIVIASCHGLFKYDAQKDAIEPDPQLENLLDGHRAYTYIQQDPSGKIWYVADGTLRRTSGKKNGKNTYLGGNMIEDFEDVDHLNATQTIVGTEDGFALIDIAKKSLANTSIKPQIRKLYVTNGKDSLIYGRNYRANEAPFSIHYRDNSIRIEYGCTNYNPSQVMSYSYRLKGFDKHWSEYTTKTSKEYTDLSEGTYTFELKMNPDDGGSPVVTSMTFTILPPWYRSWWAYTLYLLLFLYVIHFAYNRYKEGRERLIRLKDAELDRQKRALKLDIIQKQKQIDELEKDKLRNDLNYKSDELVKTTLNVVRKNEILQKIKKDAENLTRTIHDGNMVNVRRGILRLINEIDTNIEHDSDLDNFQSSFDAIHNDFFKKLEAKYPQLSYKDKMLCAYLKMNLISKEIAPLLNISVRGVEISRYRLRKKLNLDEKANLAEFLQKLE